MDFVCEKHDHVTQSCYLLLDEQVQTFEYGSMSLNTLKYIKIYISESTLLRNWFVKACMAMNKTPISKKCNCIKKKKDYVSLTDDIIHKASTTSDLGNYN